MLTARSAVLQPILRCASPTSLSHWGPVQRCLAASHYMNGLDAGKHKAGGGFGLEAGHGADGLFDTTELIVYLTLVMVMTPVVKPFLCTPF